MKEKQIQHLKDAKPFMGGGQRAIYNPRARSRYDALFIMVTALIAAGVLFLATTHSPAYAASGKELHHDYNPKPWAMYSPYTPLAPYKAPPESCHITQVNILQRHGARFPTSGAAARIVSALNKLQAVADYDEPALAFLNSYQFTLGSDDLVPFGAKESKDAGQVTYERYHHLIRRNNIPFLRASGSTRVIDSANNWTAGFAAASHGLYSPPPIAVILPETDGTNTTLEHALCPAAGKSDPQTELWQKTFSPAVRGRLSSSPRLSAEQVSAIQELTDTDIYNLMTICPFESIIYGESSFCELFAEDLKYSDYWGDLDKYYYTGYGQALGPVQGVGFVNELIARLTSSPVQDHTQTNHTLDTDPLTFPLNRTIYVDFSHDNQMIAIFSALGLFKLSDPLDPTKITKGSEWKVSRMVPFAGRMVVEKLHCSGEDKVRILVNDRVMPLKACGAKEGICSLGDFIKSQTYARHDGQGDFEKCFQS